MGLFEFNNHKLNKKIRKFNEVTKKKILNLELCQVNYKIRKLQSENTEVQYKLRHLPENILRQYQNRLEISFNRRFHLIRQANIRKINNLKDNSIPQIKTQEKWIKNLSNKELPNTVKNILSLGSKFSIPTTKEDIDINRIIADTEYILESIPSERKDRQRAKDTNAITHYIHKSTNENTPTQKWYKDTKKFLKDNSDFIILNSDKGAVTVVMEERDYDEKMNEILNSRDFKKLPRDPTQTLQTKCNKFVNKLEKLKHISKEKAKEMRTYNSVAPRMYGNPQIHKSGYPMRPIISSLNSPLNKLSKFIADILKNAYNEENEYYVRDTFHFATSINNFKLPKDYTLISLDVVNLFGNLDKNEIIEVLKQSWNEIKEHTSLNMELFLEITLFLLENNYCVFRGEYYLQVFGCAMGSKLSPRLAQYFMDHLVKSSIGKLPFRIPFLKKFVDDIFTTVPKEETQTILSSLNSYSNNLQFTLEVEDAELSVPFSDTKAQRHEDEIRLKWYRKETNSDKMIHFNSNHNINMKINVIKQMKQRDVKVLRIEKNYQKRIILEMIEINKQGNQ
ncbi:uncharacterized protein LOC123315438 [Coccinella septempunctata]|uniref:uncharacterized protein LOC123315438 n=1 Tax=Coccinella septempunctata TaxID=41139 RepID=UPI001D065B2A|nr:uncharacterized protein LOC123315438 [Coccinella septempunctata]